ncbi:hypothetical protein GYMLUDRAFT_40489 [Collybiopsis luxurians FD-317 M1]|uniref:Uncharacterized protein n=1 Tax=Collybiopsis luxurians FD-317 M1 TaxID=944289 RepID=A0A0D0BJ51_9AGAR|nr:hypothetical protein GYMLUDRAFT_40489 [Collybiopsis luxurians FD-317 M1]
MPRLSFLSIASLALAAHGAAFPSSHVKRATPATWDQLLQAQLTAVTLSYNNPVWVNGIDASMASLQSLIDESNNILGLVFNLPGTIDADWNDIQNGWFTAIPTVAIDGVTIADICQQYTDSFLSSSLLSTPSSSYLQILNSLKSNLTNAVAQMQSPAAFSVFNQTVMLTIQGYDNYFNTQEAAINNEISGIQSEIKTVRQNIHNDHINIALGNADAGLLGFDKIAAVALFDDAGEAFGDLLSAVYKKAGIDGESISNSASSDLAKQQETLSDLTISLQATEEAAVEIAMIKSKVDFYYYYVQDAANFAGSFTSFYTALSTVVDGLIAMVESGVLQNGDYWAPNPGPPVEWVTYREMGMNLLQTSCTAFGQMQLPLPQ